MREMLLFSSLKALNYIKVGSYYTILNKLLKYISPSLFYIKHYLYSCILIKCAVQVRQRVFVRS